MTPRADNSPQGIGRLGVATDSRWREKKWSEYARGSKGRHRKVEDGTPAPLPMEEKERKREGESGGGAGFMQGVNKLNNAAGRKLAARHWTAGSCAGFALPRKKFVVDACESDRGQGSGVSEEAAGAD